MGIYYYPNAATGLEAKKQFLRTYHRKNYHCFRNIGGPGYMLFDTRKDVNVWWKEHTDEIFYKDENENGAF